MRVGDVSCHMDFSNNVPVDSKIKTSGQWGNRLKVSLGVCMCYTPVFRKRPPPAEEKAEEKAMTLEDLSSDDDDIDISAPSHIFVPDGQSADFFDADDYIDEEAQADEQYRKNMESAFVYHTKDKRNDKLNERTIYCVSKDPNHNFGAALRMVEESILNTLERAKKEGWVLKNYYGYSDQSGHEFHNAAFVLGLEVLLKKYKLKRLEWVYTTPNHGKCKCDGEGHVYKWLLRLGVFNGEVIYNLGEGFEITMKKYLEKKFAEYEPDRVIVNMSLKPVKHMTSGSVAETWRGFNSYSAYRVTPGYGVQRRFLDCKCDSCLLATCECEDKNHCGCLVCDSECVAGKWSEPWKQKIERKSSSTECFWYDTQCRYNYMSKAQTAEYLKSLKANHARKRDNDLGIVDPIAIERAGRSGSGPFFVERSVSVSASASGSMPEPG
jgi:hypothetical protein